MLKEIDEIKLCKDCYRHSYEKINEHWFSLPCTKNHDLVYAKQYGFPYWPAKVSIYWLYYYNVKCGFNIFIYTILYTSVFVFSCNLIFIFKFMFY